MRRWIAWGGVCIAACAPLDGPSSAPPVDAAFVRACGDASCACGAEGMTCCEAAPRCEGTLRCAEGVCRRPAARCVATGIFQEGVLAADFPSQADPGTPPCSEVPRELFDPRTPGTFLAPALAVGGFECEGLAPGERTLRLRARVRALAQHHERDACHCNGLNVAALSVTQRGGPTWAIQQQRVDPVGGEDLQCLRGPDFDWSQRVTVPTDGHIAVQVDFTACMNDGEPRGLFLRGASLTLDEVRP
jgi:hypothetical protein